MRKTLTIAAVLTMVISAGCGRFKEMRETREMEKKNALKEGLK